MTTTKKIAAPAKNLTSNLSAALETAAANATADTTALKEIAAPAKISAAIDSMTALADKSGAQQAIVTAALAALTQLHVKGIDVRENCFTAKAMHIRDNEGERDEKSGRMKLGKEGTISYKKAARLRAALSTANRELQKAGELIGGDDDDTLSETWVMRGGEVKHMELKTKPKTVKHDIVKLAEVYAKDTSNLDALSELQKAIDAAKAANAATLANAGKVKGGAVVVPA